MSASFGLASNSPATALIPLASTRLDSARPNLDFTRASPEPHCIWIASLSTRLPKSVDGVRVAIRQLAHTEEIASALVPGPGLCYSFE